MENDKRIQYLFERTHTKPLSAKPISRTANDENYKFNVNAITMKKNKTFRYHRYHWADYPNNEINAISDIVHKNKRKNKLKVLKTEKRKISSLFDLNIYSRGRSIARPYSMTEIKSRHGGHYENANRVSQDKSIDTVQKKPYFYLNTDFVVNNCCQTCDKPECLNPFINPLVRARIYRCQLNAQEETCCCSCNSDAMFEVMKSLYDCYKKKNCDHCDCILCGYLPKEERRLGEQRKSAVSVAVETASAKIRKKEKMAKAKAAGLLTPLEGKTPEQRDKIIRGLAKLGIPLPEGKTASEKELINKIRKELGLPPEPKTPIDKEKYKKAEIAGVLTPLEGKSPEQKEKILRKQAELGIPLPEGRTKSEKALIEKIKASLPPVKTPSERLRRAKAAGFITPLEGKTPEQKEKILKGLAMHGIPLPEPGTPSERKLIDKVRAELGLPPEPTSPLMKAKHKKAMADGVLTPLDGKSPSQKENILRGQARLGLPLPEGRTPSEKSLIAKVKATTKPLSDNKMRAAMEEGLLSPLKGKTPEQKEKIIRGLAKLGLPLPEGNTPSEKEILAKVRKDMGLPREPKTLSEKIRMDKGLAGGIITTLGKTTGEKENVLRKMAEAGIPLPEGRTTSEKSLIAKVEATTSRKLSIPSGKLRKAKAAGLLTPLEGKTPEQKEKILKGLAEHGIPLPKGKTDSEKRLIDKIRADIGLPPEPKTPKAKEKYKKALAAGLITPLEGKTPAQKEKILRGQADLGLPLPEGRTPSEKALIANIKATARPPSELELRGITSEKLKAAKAAGLLTPLEGKSPARKENIIRGLAKNGLPLPEGKTNSEKKLIDKVRKDLGLPPEPKTQSQKEKYAKAQAAGLLTPLDGKSPAQKERILRGQAEMGLPLPEGRTTSEKSLIAKVKATTKPLSEARIPSEKLRRAKAEGLLTPLEGKTPEQKEKILKGLAKHGIPLPEGKTDSEKKIINKVRAEVGLPPEPKSPSDKEKYRKAIAGGLITPLEGKSPAQKEKILRRQAEMGLPLPEGRTSTEKSLIARIKATTKPLSDYKVPSEKMRAAKAAGLLTPLEGKTPEQKEKILKGLAEHGIPLPEAKTASEKKLIDKVRAEVGLPPEPRSPSIKHKYRQAMASGLITPLEGKTPAQKEKILRGQAEMGLPLPEGRTPSEKSLIAKVKATTKPLPDYKIPPEKIRAAKAAGFLTPLEGKTPEQKEKILKGLAKHGIPLPEAKTPSEKKLIDKVRAEVGLPPEPGSPSIKHKYRKAMASGLITPLEGKTPAQKEKILRGQAEMGLPLPEGRTPSEKSLIAKVKATTKPLSEYKVPSEKMRAAKAAGFLTPLEGKTPEQKEKIIKGLAKHGIPLPEGKTPSEKKLIDKVRAEVGLPPEPTSPSIKQKYRKAMASGLITPLEGKTPAQKEKILRGQAEMGLPLPEGRTPSEKSLIAKVKATTKPLSDYKVPSEKMRAAKAAGFLTPLEGKTPDQKEKILKGLAKYGIPLPEGKTRSEKKLIDKVRADLGLPPEPKSPSIKQKYRNALAAGIITPLEGKSPEEKEKILKRMAEAGIPLPEGRTPSEKALIAKVKAAVPAPARRLSQKMRDARAAGLLTPLEGKTPEQKQNILRGLAKAGLLLPEPKTKSEKALLDKIRDETGLPPEPDTPSLKEKYKNALNNGIITPLEGKTPAEKAKILKRMHDAGITLPVGRTASEKSLINEVRASPLTKIPSEKIRAAKAAGLLTTLDGKTPQQKENIIRGLAKIGLPLPEGKTPSEKQLVKKVRAEMGLPPEPRTQADKEKMAKALASGIVTPLEGKTPAQKEKILKSLAEAGIPLPEGRTPSERSLIAKVKAALGVPLPIPSEKIRKAKAEGLLTPLEGKTPAQKEKILKGLIDAGLPVPEGITRSDRALVKKVRVAAGLPPEATPSEKKGKIKTRTRGLGVTSKKSGRGAAISKSKGGIVEELEEIVKTTVCDRACGCDKKKIKFKHSYVKIRVTSPDMSSFCPCPDECIPGVKGGVLVDSEGIKVTVGRAEDITLFNFLFSNRKIESDFGCLDTHWCCSSVYSTETVSSDFSTYKASCNNKSLYGTKNLENSPRYCNIEHILKHSPYNISNSYLSLSYKYHSNFRNYGSEDFYDPTTNMSTETLGTNSTVSVSSSADTFSVFSRNSILKVASSLSLSTDSCNSHLSSLSVISILGSTLSSVSNECSPESDDSVENGEHFNDKIAYNIVSTSASNNHSSQCYSETFVMKCHTRSRRKDTTYKDDIIICRLSKSTDNEDDNQTSTVTDLKDGKHFDNAVVWSDLYDTSGTNDIIKIVNEILSRNWIAATSSVFVVVPSEEDETTALFYSDVFCSTASVNISKDFVNLNKVTGVFRVDDDSYVPPAKLVPIAHGLKISKKRRKQTPGDIAPNTTNKRRKGKRISLFDSKKGRNVVGTDTSVDRPCCCAPRPCSEEELFGSVHRILASVGSIPTVVLQRNPPSTSPAPRCQELFKKIKNAASNDCGQPQVDPGDPRVPEYSRMAHPHPLPGACADTHADPPRTEHKLLAGINRILHKTQECQETLQKLERAACAQRLSKPLPPRPAAPPPQSRTPHPVPLSGHRFKGEFATYNELMREMKPCEPVRGTSRRPPTRGSPCCLLPRPLPLPGLSERAPRRAVQFTLGGAPAARCRCKSCKDGRHEPCICIQGPEDDKKHCECPELDSSESYEYLAYEDWACPEDFEWVSKDYILKMKSDMTQTTSGFKMSVSQRRPVGVMRVAGMGEFDDDMLVVEEDMSFEDALMYFAENKEGNADAVEDLAEPPAEMDIFGHERCTCETKAKRIVDTTCANENGDCQCPPPPAPIEPPPFILPMPSPPLTPFPISELGAESPPGGPFNMSGFKLTIGAKGNTSGSRGLCGICCFDMTGTSLSDASSEYLLLH